ncbi:MAG: hypothetical protein IPM46_14935 [Flavobacteriales bacterium]|nr:hypothetical protein [Flavobacteriales bacterium]
MLRLEHLLARRLAHPRRLHKGLRDLLFLGIAYSLAIVLLALGDVGPGMASWLAIPAEDYFKWEPLFTTPVIFFSGLLSAAVLHLLARWLGGTGSFEDTVALIGPATAWATLCTLIPDAVIGMLLIAGVIDPTRWMADIVRPSPTLAIIWVYLLLYVAAFALLYPMVARLVYGLAASKARVAGWLAFIVYQALLLVFIR